MMSAAGGARILPKLAGAAVATAGMHAMAGGPPVKLQPSKPS